MFTREITRAENHLVLFPPPCNNSNRGDPIEIDTTNLGRFIRSLPMGLGTSGLEIWKNLMMTVPVRCDKSGEPRRFLHFRKETLKVNLLRR